MSWMEPTDSDQLISSYWETLAMCLRGIKPYSTRKGTVNFNFCPNKIKEEILVYLLITF